MTKQQKDSLIMQLLTVQIIRNKNNLNIWKNYW